MRKNILISIAAALAAASMAGSADAALVISKAPTNNVSCSAGICNATAADAVLNVTDLKKLLQKADLKVISGSAAQDISVDAKFKWTKPFRLTLDAYRSIVFKLAAVAEGTGSVTLITNDGGTGGDYSFIDKGKLTFWDTSSSLVINGAIFTLVKDIATLAADTAANPSGMFALSNGYDASVDGKYRNFAVASAFGGTFDGLGHLLSNVQIEFSNKLSPSSGFFKQIMPSGIVRDLAFVNLAMLHRADYAGGLTPENDGLVSNLIIAGISVTGHRCAGGLVSDNKGVIKNAFVSGSVSSWSFSSAAGGLVCENDGSIVSSSANAQVAAPSQSFAGGLAATNSGSVLLSSAFGSTSVDPNDDTSYGDEGAGSLVGANTGTIDRSYAMGDAHGGQCQAHEVKFNVAYAGGLVALDYGSVRNSYAAGNAFSSQILGPCGAATGGLVGAAAESGTVTTSYSTGHPECASCTAGGLIGVDPRGSVSNSYWDIDTSGLDTSAGGTGLSDAQLKSGLPAGFDPGVWGQSASINNGYPYLIGNPPPQ